MFLKSPVRTECTEIEKNFNPQIANFDDKNQYIECIHALYGMSADQWQMYIASVIAMFVFTLLILFFSRYAWEKGSEISLETLFTCYLFALDEDDRYTANPRPFRERIPKKIGFMAYLFQDGIVNAIINILVVLIFGSIMYIGGIVAIGMLCAIAALAVVRNLGIEQSFVEQSKFAPDRYDTSEAYCVAYHENYLTENISVQAKLLYQDCFNTLYPTTSWFQFHPDQWIWLLFFAICSFIFLKRRSRFGTQECISLTIFIIVINFIMMNIISIIYRYMLFGSL